MHKMIKNHTWKNDYDYDDDDYYYYYFDFEIVNRLFFFVWRWRFPAQEYEVFLLPSTLVGN